MIYCDPVKVNSKISRASVIYIDDAFYVIGGNTDVNDYDSTLIAQFFTNPLTQNHVYPSGLVP